MGYEKVKIYAAIADETAEQITNSYVKWTEFLTTASRLYKYPYQEQLMIYAQRPDATACADYDLWNQKMRRYVRRGSKGIALLDTSRGRPRLKYVFDISDTGEGTNARRPFLWEYRPEEHQEVVMEALEHRFEVSGEQGLVHQLEGISSQLAEEYWEEHQRDILDIVDGSFLEGYDEFNVGVQFRNAAAVSITYSLLSRCGLEPDEHFEHEDFLSIFDFNTPEAVAALGTAVSQSNQTVLRQIGIVLQNYEREKFAERSVTHGEQPDLLTERGLSHSQPDPERTAGGEAPGQVRADAPELPGGTPSRVIQFPASEREAVSPPAGDRRDSEPPSRADDAGANEVGGRNGGAEGQRPHEMGGVDEHPESAGGGNPPDGTYLQLTLNLFPSEQEQVQRIEEAESVKTPSAFSMPQADARPDRAALITQADVDALLIQDWGVPGRKQQIQKWYRDGLTDQELEEPLRSVYNLSPDIVPPRTGGNFTLADGTKGYAYYVAAGVRIENHKNGGWREISYEEMARHIRVLIDTDRYLTPAEREAAEKEEPPAQEAEPDAPAASRSSVPTNPQAAIDEALREWNGDPESKRRVAAHMEAHARDKGTAAFLRAEYGDDLPAFPVTGAATDLPWPKVQRRLAQLMERGAFLEETELPAREVPDLTDQPVTRQGDTITIGTGEATHEIDVTVTDEQWQAIQEAIPEAGPEPRLGPSPSVREIFEHYLPIVKDHVLSDTAYQNACKNSDKENAYLEGAEAVKRAAISIEDANFLRLYYDLTGFHNSLHEQVLDETYPMLAQASGMAEQAQAAPDRDTDAPPYQVGDMVYLDGTAFEIKEIRDWEVQLLDPALSYPIFRAESRENFERLLRQDSRNGAITEFLASDLERINDDLRDVLASGLLTLRDKEYICGWLRSGEGNTRIAQRLSHTFAGRAETMELETGETADYFTSTIGMEVEIQDKYASRLSISWQDAAPVLRTLYQQELDGFSRDPEAFRRFLVEETSDAFEEPFIIRDSQTGEYYGVGGIYQTFPTLEEARQYADGLNHPVLEGVPAYEVGDKVMLPYGDHELSGTVGHVGETAVRIDGTGPYSWDHQVVDREHFEDGLRQDARNAALFTPEEAAQATENFRITDDALGVGGPKTKFRRNVEAIRTLKQIEDEGRAATPAEQETLSQYVGWGGLPDAFDPDKEEWAEEYAELKGLLAPDEYTSARASTLTAHYTSPTIIKAIYEAMGNLGFREGNLLEPSCGVGNFFGLLPENMGKSKMYGVELDSISGRIARQLYPQANITIRSFEKTNFPDDFFDAAIGNVPFGGYKLVDSRYDKQNLLIHEYFLAKSIDKVRPGGVLAFITSNGISGGTMDKKDRHVREYLAERCDLLGAVRLPNNAFLANAGTDTTTDILFLQKLDTPRQLGVDLPLWVQTDTLLEQDHTNDKGETRHNFVTVNRYFQEHPEMVLGELKIVSGPFGPQLTCEPVPDASLAEQLHEAISHIKGRITEAELPDLGEGEEIDASIPADPNVKNYSYTIVEGEVYYRENSRMVKPDLNATARERVKGMVELRECVQDLIFYQMDNYPDEAIIRQQAKLNGLYDAFTSKYGLINSKGNALAFADDSSYYLLCSLEVLDEDGRLERKADMFSKRTIRPHQAVTSVDTASEALAVSISEKARVDMPYMAKLSGKTEEELAGELQGVIFRLPEPVDSDGNPRHVTADEYLSGNIREKLLRARQAADKIPEYFRANVEALEQALPKDLEASEIDVRLGATWVDKKYIQQFMYETFQTPGYLKNRIHVNFTDFTAEWNITEKNSIPWSDVAAFTTYGTERASAYRILEDSLNLRDVRIYDTVQDPDGKEKRVLNKDATTLAQQKQQAIKDAFRDWIWKDPDRRQALVRKYNDLYNSTRPREYDGQHIIFGGINPEIKLREHQLNAIAHILYGDNVLLAHEVGAGKTFEMVAAAMESKRLGLCQKSLFAVPNHLIEQWASEFLRLYPSANILVTRKKDFEGPNRKKFCAKIATGDYDAVIMGHSQFERLPMSFERRERLLQEQIWEIEEGLEELKNSHAEKFSVKQLERTKRSLEARLEKLHDGTRKDDVVTFEQLGVDRLFIDEAHSYKNLFLYTKMRNVAGLSTSDAQKSSDMLLKCRYMDEVTGGKGVVFATGTPVSNSMTELYTMQRYLQHDLISRQGLAHFDNWASTFGETVTAIELAPEGKYRARTRFARFFNLPELMNMFKETADIKTADQLNLPVPEVEFHNEVAQPTEHQQMLVQELSERAAEVHAGHVDPRTDNMLKITSDGRKLGLDQRLINPMLPDDPQSKVNLCVDNIVRIWQEGQPEKLTQLLFCDLSTPKGKTAAKQEKAARTAGDKTAGGTELHALDNLLDVKPDPPFSIYEDIRDKLIARGIPASQIAFIHDADTDARKKELFSKVRSGQVRVLMGSTQKMGAGMNVQDRLVALHDLDCPWRPGDLELRKGRIVRQGNKNKKVHIYRYVTEGTFDSYLWQTVENKQKFISQIMTSKSPVRSCEDVDETALSYAEIKALCAGNPLIKEKMDLDVDVSRLRLLKANHQSQQYRLEDDLLKHFPEQIEQNKGYVTGFTADMATLAAHPHPKDGFAGMVVRGDTLTEKDNAGAAILAACKEIKGTQPLSIGTYRGFDMSLTVENFGHDFVLTLKGQMTHRVTLGQDARGNLTRIDNALAGMPERLAAVQDRLANLDKQVEAAKAELGKPFPQELELAEKSARLAELNARLDLDTNAPGQQTARTPAKKERSSVLEGLKRPLPPRTADRKSKQHEQEVR